MPPNYVHLSNAYAQLQQLSEDQSPPTHSNKTSTPSKAKDQTKHQRTFKLMAERRRQTKFTTYIYKMKDEGIIEAYITKAEDERTAMSKSDCLGDV